MILYSYKDYQFLLFLVFASIKKNSLKTLSYFQNGYITLSRYVQWPSHYFDSFKLFKLFAGLVWMCSVHVFVRYECCPSLWGFSGRPKRRTPSSLSAGSGAVVYLKKLSVNTIFSKLVDPFPQFFNRPNTIRTKIKHLWSIK